MKKNRILIYLSAVIMAGALAGCENNIYSDEEATNMALLMASMSQNAAAMASEAQVVQSSLLGIGGRAVVQGEIEEPLAPGASCSSGEVKRAILSPAAVFSIENVFWASAAGIHALMK